MTDQQARRADHPRHSWWTVVTHRSTLAGRTLRDLILGRSTELTALPWVQHRSRRWEPEPIRFLGVNAGLRVMTSADRSELRTGRQSRRAAFFGRFTGH